MIRRAWLAARRDVRTNGDPEVVRSFGEDLKKVADKLTAPLEPWTRRTEEDSPPRVT